ncbi:ABC transporter ATP-binding protein [Jonesia quinghaiensis]|uniref:ABC transporter ATP-binding protein n=1 Tax=Jonesia quinghaiensis TaxID=262806 RepID=UPI0004238428|nr:ATP-binding cassette domain-containing protein [Jonesia quinghaiensis]
MTIQQRTVKAAAELDGVTQKYRNRTALNIDSLTLLKGITALVGPNGAGKSTLMSILSTARRPTSGHVTIDGIPTTTRSHIVDARRVIGYLPQGFSVDTSFRVADLVAYAAWLRGIPGEEIPDATKKALEKVDLIDRSRDRIKKLSGGMLQRVGIATAIVGEPRLVILDEPTVGLDPRQRALFREVIRGISNAAVLVSTHLIDDVDALADRVVLLEDGEVRFNDTLETLKELAPAQHSAHSDLEAAYLVATSQ